MCQEFTVEPQIETQTQIPSTANGSLIVIAETNILTNTIQTYAKKYNHNIKCSNNILLDDVFKFNQVRVA